MSPFLPPLAIDAKDEKLSKNRAWEILNAALAERDAGFAILLVASDEKVPSGRQQLHEYEGNKMIVTLDKETLDGGPLELAYRYARCRHGLDQLEGVLLELAALAGAPLALGGQLGLGLAGVAEALHLALELGDLLDQPLLRVAGALHRLDDGCLEVRQRVVAVLGGELAQEVLA